MVLQADIPSRFVRDVFDNMVARKFALLKNFHEEIFVEGQIQFDSDSEASNAGGRFKRCEFSCHDGVEIVAKGAVAAILLESRVMQSSNILGYLARAILPRADKGNVVMAGRKKEREASPLI